MKMNDECQYYYQLKLKKKKKKSKVYNSIY